MLVFSKLNNDPSNLTEADFDSWAVPELLEHYKDKITLLAQLAYGNVYANDGASVSLRAFNELAGAEIRKGLTSFYINCQHWRTDRDLNSYLLTCLNRLSNRIKFDANAVKKSVVPICPGCKSLGQKEFVRYENRILRCTNCTNEQIRLEEEIVSLSRKEDAAGELSVAKAELRLRRIFALHSRKGFGCPDCGRFIPESYIDQFGVSCVYNNCGWFGALSELIKMAYPTTMMIRTHSSLDAPMISNNLNHEFSLQDVIPDTNQNNEDSIIVQEQFENELKVLKETIATQLKRVESNENKSIQKQLMYRAFQNLTESDPVDMVSYLVHLKHFGDSPIQSRIFQEYVRLVENQLPFSIRGSEVFSLQDGMLGIFLGLSNFAAKVDAHGLIPNNTIETYVGGRKLTQFGPCFIGLLVDVIDTQTGQSIKNEVESYSFSSIKMNADKFAGRSVSVSHLRISPHYEMGSLVYLQRIRRKIVDSVYFKIHGKKRPLSRGQANDYILVESDEIYDTI